MTILIKINPKAKFNYSKNGIEIYLDGSENKLKVNNLRPGLSALICSLKEKNLSYSDHMKSIKSKYPKENFLNIFANISKIEQLGLLIYECQISELTLLKLEPQNSNFKKSEKVKGDIFLSLNQNFNMVLAKDKSSFLIEIPFSNSFIKIINIEILNIIYQFRKKSLASNVENKVLNLSNEDLFEVLTLLVNANVLLKNETGENNKKENEQFTNLWNVSDLNFHHVSRYGFHRRPLGATWRGELLGIRQKDLTTKYLGKVINLKKPSINTTQPGFFDVIESRRSIRNYDETNLIDSSDISSLLWYSYRIKKELGNKWSDKLENFSNQKNDNSCNFELNLRPVPAGGSIHELELYLLINKAKNIKKGFYHYQARDHSLEIIKDELCDNAKRLLEESRKTAAIEHYPHVLIIIAAEYGKLAYKYEDITYSLILKHSGVLIQQLYLVATALNLAPSALGTGNIDLFSKITGLNILKQTSVAEFILGSKI